MERRSSRDGKERKERARPAPTGKEKSGPTLEERKGKARLGSRREERTRPGPKAQGPQGGESQAQPKREGWEGQRGEDGKARPGQKESGWPDSIGKEEGQSQAQTKRRGSPIQKERRRPGLTTKGLMSEQRSN